MKNPDFSFRIFSVKRGFWTILSLEKYSSIMIQYTVRDFFASSLKRGQCSTKRMILNEFNLHVSEIS